MKKAAITFLVLLVLIIAGCDYDTPISEKQGLPLDNSLIGNWEHINAEGKKININISRLSSSEYAIHLDKKDFLRGYPVKIADISCIQLVYTDEKYKPVTDLEKYLVMSYEITNGELSLKKLSTSIVSGELKSSTELRKAFLQNKNNKELFTSLPDKFINTTTAKTSENPLNANTSAGRYYALVIGINSYQDKDISRLQMAENDAKVVDSTLRDNFGFQTKLLLNANANRQQIFAALSQYRRTLTEADSLLIYYAGHGIYDAEADNAYWLPVDASRDDPANWISANDITSNLRANPAKHILVVSDSCYSGTLTRQAEIILSEPSARERLLKRMIDRKSRTLMASGGNEPVSDGGGGKHSVFARAFLRALTETDESVFTANEIFRDIQEAVAGGANQTPEYKLLSNSGHDGGDFVFIRK